jgi:hypothetical protein
MRTAAPRAAPLRTRPRLNAGAFAVWRNPITKSYCGFPASTQNEGATATGRSGVRNQDSRRQAAGTRSSRLRQTVAQPRHLCDSGELSNEVLGAVANTETPSVFSPKFNAPLWLPQGIIHRSADILLVK